jgi:hypothetical protein
MKNIIIFVIFELLGIISDFWIMCFLMDNLHSNYDMAITFSVCLTWLVIFLLVGIFFMDRYES